ncbi:MAG: polysaccharide biosynthesis tyrosine autokinase [Leptolyngbya sp. SIO4C1]|nr:polysaccharide biosynthesis tyrosine autokinase [Leptolyngbya sp. SIO4C1]
MPPDEEAEGGIELGRILAALRRQALLIAGITTVTASAAVFKALTDTPTYRAGFEVLAPQVTLETQIISSANPAAVSGDQEVISVGLDETKLKLLKSPRVIDPVVEKLKVAYPNVTYNQIVKGLTLNTNGDNILTVSYRHANPEFVKDVLDVLAAAYLQFSLEDRQSDILRGISFVDEQLPALRERVDFLQGELEALRQQYNLIDPVTQGERLSGQIQDFNQEELALQVQLNEATALYQELQQELFQNGEVAASSVLSDDPRYQKLVDKLIDIDSQIAQESAIFLEASPEMEIFQEQRENLSPLLAREGDRVLRELGRQIEVLNVRKQSLSNNASQLNQEIKQISSVARQYSDIQRELEIATSNLNQFLSKREALRIDAAQRQSPWELLSQASVPQAAVASAKRNLVFGTAIGLMLGTGAALLLDRLRNVIHSVKDIKEITNLPLIGAIPLNEDFEEFGPAAMMASQTRSSDPTLEDFARGQENVGSYRSSAFVEAFRSLSTNIRLLNPDTPVRSIAISSSTPNAGKTTMSVHLGQTSAAMGQRVLIVDTDLRRPSIHRRVGVTNDYGITNFVSGELSFDMVVRQLPWEPNLCVVTAGAIPPDPTKTLSSQRMKSFMERAEELFDLVIYDTPPILGFADSQVIANRTSGLLLTIGVGKLKRNLLEQALETIKLVNIPILGLVANGVKEQISPTYKYYNKYYEYYTYTRDFETFDRNAWLVDS